ncbi:MAG: sterol desaturase family protein [Deltaproteobacteria bacterium]|nr:sterol desaturase family protein [Deltaproteobacteria bacterium]
MSGERIASVTIFPAFVALIAALALLAPRYDLGAALGLAPDPQQPLTFVAVLGVLYALIAAAERWLPYRREWNVGQDDARTDVGHLLVNGLLTSRVASLLVYGIGIGGAAWLSIRLGVQLWPNHWPLALQLVLALAVAELGHYWFHRLTHERPLLWRIHAAHHSAPRLYWLNATRFHPFDLFGLIVCQTLPLILLGAGAPVMVAYGLFSGAYGQLQHGNIAVRTGALRYVFSTPELHRWHHSPDPREGNTNYGAVLSCWDVLFGTFFYPADRRFRGPVGIADAPNFPRHLGGQLLSPFR